MSKSDKKKSDKKIDKKRKEYIFIYATFPAKKTVMKISENLIQKKLVVCANISEHDSIYSWNGRVYEEKEYAVFFKTRGDKWKAAREFILKEHPYETPVILKLRIRGYSPGFEKWMNDSLDK